MKLVNKQFGEVQYDQEKVLDFENGLLGFEELKQFLLIKTDNELIFWLCSIDQPEIVFPLIGLRLIDDSYPQSEDEEAFGIVKLDSDHSKITVNLKAPVYVNQDEKTGFQTIIDHDSYQVNYKLFKD